MKCRICEGPRKGSYGGKLGALIKEENLCFTCAFWTEKSRDPSYMSRTAIIDGCAHFPEPAKISSPYPRMLGCAGAKVTIKYNDGRVVRTNDLWVQGGVPGHLRELFPDNAVFVKETPEEWEKGLKG